MASERLGHELFQIVEKPNGSVNIKGHNGMWISATGEGIRQDVTAR